MSNDFIENTIRRFNLNQLFLSLAGIAIVLIGLVLSGRYLVNMVFGPFQMDKADLLALKDANLLKYYVTVEGDDHATTGYSYVSTSDSGKENTEAYYNVLLVNDRLLLVKSGVSEIQNRMTGALVNNSTEINTKVINELEAEMPQIKGAFLPFMLDTTNFYTAGYIGLAIGGVLGLVALFGFVLSIYRLLNLEAHPAIKNLARFGEVNSTIATINSEMDTEHEQIGKKIHFTQNWVVSTASGLAAAPYRDLIWCYKQVTQHRTNGIPTGKTYALTLFDRFGKNVILPGKEPEVDQMINIVERRAGGVVLGYSKDLAAMWQKDRQKFILAVDDRRRR